MMTFVEMDRTTTIHDQLEDIGGQVVLINLFIIEPHEADKLIAAWADDAAWMKRQAGFISTQLHRGIAGSGTFLNYAVWKSTMHFKAAFSNPEFQMKLAHYPSSAVASPHLFRKWPVEGICEG